MHSKNLQVVDQTQQTRCSMTSYCTIFTKRVLRRVLSNCKRKNRQTRREHFRDKKGNIFEEDKCHAHDIKNKHSAEYI